MKINNQTLAIILGGGQGSRLYPLTESRSKPAVPIAGKYRLVDIPISNCINNHIHRMFVLTQFNSASLNKHIKNTYQFGLFSAGFVDILAAEQTPDNAGWYQGTADAVRQSLKHFMPHDSDYILILSGDQLYQMDFTEMIENHKKTGAEITVASIPVNAKDATGFGIMKVEDGMIKSFIEKPSTELLPQWKSDTGEQMISQGKDYMASMGIYLFNKQLLFDLLEKEFSGATDFGKEIIPQSIVNYKVASYQYEGYWTDIGNIDSFFEANLDLNKDFPQFNLFDDNNRIYTRARLLPPIKINGTHLKQSLVADGSIIFADNIENSLIGIRSRIGKGSSLKNCYMMGADYYETLEVINNNLANGISGIGIGTNSHLENCIIDKNSRVGDNVKIIGGNHLQNQENELLVVKDGIVVIKKEAHVPNNYELK